MDEDSLKESAWRRGWAATERGLRSWQFWALEVIVGGGLGVLTQSAPVAFLFVVGMFFFMWLGATMAAPVLQRNEARSFALELISPTKDKEALDRLSDLLDVGTHLYQEKLTTRDDYPDWKARVNNWAEETGNELATAFGKPENKLFMMLEGVVAAQLLDSVHPMHNNKRLHLDTRLKKLRRIIENRAYKSPS